MGASRRSITAKIGGGASMFNFHDKNLIMDIGNRNIWSVKESLLKLSVPLIGEDTGGSQGRTMILDIGSGKTFIKTVNSAIREI
jgi:chemotaxis protein CheD